MVLNDHLIIPLFKPVLCSLEKCYVCSLLKFCSVTSQEDRYVNNKDNAIFCLSYRDVTREVNIHFAIRM